MRTDPPKGVELHGTYGGHRYVHVGEGRFEFPSLTERDVTHITDIHERNCTCWAFRVRPTDPCVHMNLVAGILKKIQKQQQPLP